MSKLGFGFMRLPLLNAQDETSVDMEQVKKMVDMYLDRGYTYFDTAHRYHGGMSEKAIDQALTSRKPRESYELTNKITLVPFIHSQEEQLPFFEEQLEICGVTFFDNYLIHNMNGNTYPLAQKYHTFEFIESLKEKGLVRQIGFSFHGSPDLLETILTDHPNVDVVQLQLNYVDWLDAGVQSKKCYDICCAHNKKVLCMESIKGGNLINLPQEAQELLKKKHPDWTFAYWALAFCATLENTERVLSGMSSLEQLEENTRDMKCFVPLNEEEMELLQKVAELVRSNTAIACTGCQYCESYCPQHIAIPSYFALYNAEHRESVNYVHASGMYYNAICQTKGKASDCIKCGVCETHCPQHLPIRDYLVDVKEYFEK